MRLPWILLPLLLVSVVAAAADQTALVVKVSFYPNGSASFDDLQVTIAGIDQQSPLKLGDRLDVVLDGTTYYTTSIPVTFTLLDVPRPAPKMSFVTHLPYYGNKGVLQLMYNNKTVATFDLSELCNNDGYCHGFENGLSCPADCEVTMRDHVCKPYPDGGCDPDCAPGLDPDCGVKPGPSPNIALYLFGALFLLIVVGFGIYELLTRRQRRH